MSFLMKKKLHIKKKFSSQGNWFSQLVGLIYLLDNSTIYYSIRCGINPSPIISTEFVKSRRRDLMVERIH